MNGVGFRWPVRVYYEDTDSAGIVYHANFLKFMERARTEWIREIGYDQERLAREQRVIFVITRCDVDFLQPARFNEQLMVTARVTRCGRASIEFEQLIMNGAQEPICRGLVKVGCIDIGTMKPRGMPPDMFAEIRNAC